MKQRDNIWTVRVTEWQPRDDRRRHGRWINETISFAVVTWNRQASVEKFGRGFCPGVD